MKKFILFTALWVVYGVLEAQINRANRLFSYKPAPGQFINNPLIGTPEAARLILTSDNSLVSLGAFGGSLVLGFDRAVKNNPSNPYGIDFTIFGNAFSGSSEAGIVWVMKDENGNGLPDDTWFQIAGSSYFHPQTIHNYSITWYRQPDGSAIWKDNQGKSGVLQKNEFHPQSYYPDPQFFDDYPPDSVTMSGTLLGHSSMIVNGQIVLPALAFGYADNQPVNRSVSPDIPDNPYTPSVREGAGGDPIDISWAVNADGEYVDLDEIHFVKIVTGALSNMGVLGEISTETGAVVAAEPTGISGAENITVIHPHPPTMLVNDTLAIYADFFRKGRRIISVLDYEISDPVIASVSAAGTITAKDGGTLRVTVTPDGWPDESKVTEIYIRRPDSLYVDGWEFNLPAGESFIFRPVLLDQDNREITATEWVTEVQDIDLMQLVKNDESYTLNALKPGNSFVRIYPKRFPRLAKNYPVAIIPGTEKISIYATAKTGNENLFPARWVEIAPFSVNLAVDNRTADYSNPGFVSAAQVVMSVLQAAGVNFRFRDDNAVANKLYLYSVEADGLFTYGWGGKTEPAAFARAWMIRHKGHHFSQGLDQISIANGDSVIIYHVDNLMNDWVLTGLNASSDSIRQTEPVELFRWMVNCTRSSSGVISESAVLPMADRPVYLNAQTTPIAFTNSLGRSQIVITEPLPSVLHSDNDAVYIANRLVTNVTVKHTGQIAVFPNPAREVIQIKGLTHPASVQIYDTTGRLWHSGRIGSLSEDIFINSLSEGVYIIVVEEVNITHRLKFLKR